MARAPFTVKIDERVIARARAAAFGMQEHDRNFTLAELVENALEAHVTALEERHNDAAPFPPIVHPLRRGRRLNEN